MIDYSMLKAISKISDDQKVKSIVNSLNPNQQNSKNWLITESLKYFQAFEQPRFLIAAGWYGLLANKLTEFGSVVSFDKDSQCKEIGEKLYPNVKFKTYGCGSAIASSSLLTEWVKGKTLDEATEIKNTDIAEELALPPVKIHCSVLAEDAIKTAIADLQGKQQAEGTWSPK